VSGITTFNSALLNENQREFTQFGVLRCKNPHRIRRPIVYFTRYNNLHFIPDRSATCCSTASPRTSADNLHQRHSGDASYLINARTRLRAGFTVSAERPGRQYLAGRSLRSSLRRSDNNPTPQSITDDVAKLAWLAGVYVQDEWKITSQLTMNAGLRFDQMWSLPMPIS